MKKITFLLLLATLISCKKEEAEKPAPLIIGMRLIIQPTPNIENIKISYPDGRIIKKYSNLTVGIIDTIYAEGCPFYKVSGVCSKGSYVWGHLFYGKERGELQMINSDSTIIKGKILTK